MGYFVKLFTKLSNDIFSGNLLGVYLKNRGNFRLLPIICGLVFMLFIMMGISFFNEADIQFGDF